MNQTDARDLLIQTDSYLQESKEWLLHSYQICSGIGKKSAYSIEEMDTFEALSSRFAHSSDILIQQMLNLAGVFWTGLTGQKRWDILNLHMRFGQSGRSEIP